VLSFFKWIIVLNKLATKYLDVFYLVWILSQSTLPCETYKSYFVKIPMVKNHEVKQLLICIKRTFYSISYVKVTHSWHSIYLKTQTQKVSEDSVETVFRRNAKRALLRQINSRRCTKFLSESAKFYRRHNEHIFGLLILGHGVVNLEHLLLPIYFILCTSDVAAAGASDVTHC